MRWWSMPSLVTADSGTLFPNVIAPREKHLLNAAVPTSRARDSHRALIIVLTVLAAGLLWFVSDKIHYLTHYSLASYTDYYWLRRAGLLPHLLGGSLAIVAGLVQIWLGLTGRVSTLHRTLGKVYAIGVLIGSVGGIYMALTIPPGYRPYATGLIGLDVAWIVTTSMALYAIHLRNIEQHRDWMLRSYTVTFAFVTFRLATLWVHRWLGLVDDDPVADGIDTAVAWACWALPLLLVEPLIQLRSMRRPAG
jgi:uncharacterized membrane protein YozB (DUF420 family)